MPARPPRTSDRPLRQPARIARHALPAARAAVLGLLAHLCLALGGHLLVAPGVAASPASTLPLPSRPRFDERDSGPRDAPHGGGQATADGEAPTEGGDATASGAPRGPSVRYAVIAPEGKPVTPTPPSRPPDDAELTEEERQYQRWAYDVLASLRFHKGEIDLPTANAKLNLTAGYEYLDADDARRVLEEVWGNPPGEAPLGLIMPEGQTPFAADSWGIVLHYRPLGRVPDGDRERIDFAALIEPLKAQVQVLNEKRKAEGYATAALLGWSSLPRYDLQRHILQWGTMSQFSNESIRTMNHEVRLLGRAGVLSMSIVADANHYPQIVARVPTIIDMFTWKPGNSYDDYDEDSDVRAAGGLDTLITGTLPVVEDEGTSWWWALLALPLLALAAWQFLRWRRAGGRGPRLPGVRLRVRTR